VKLTGAEIILECLLREGVEVMFGYPGGAILPTYDAMTKYPQLRHVLVRHEQGAGFMADGYARASGRPGVCILITGPGVANAATAIGQAYSDSVPMLVLSSVNARVDLGKGRGRLHEITSQQAMMAPLTAFSRTVLDPADLPEAMAEAFAVFETQRPRPVHIEVPLDVLAAPAARSAAVPSVKGRPRPDSAELRAATDLLRASSRPVMIAGGGTIDCGERVLELARRVGAPVVLTTAAKGVVPEDDPLCLGATLSLQATQDLLRSADLVIAVGTELAETDSWIDRLPLSGRLLRIDIDPATLTRDYPAEVAILGDASETLAALAERIEGAPTGGEAVTAEELDRVRRLNRESFSPLRRKHAAVLDALRAALPEDGMVATDMTQIAYTGNVYFPCRRPRCWFHPIGFGTLGYGLPAAIGAKLAQPSRAAVALVGDAGLLFTVQELGTAAELGLPVAILLWNNDGLGQIAGDMVERGIPEIGVKPRNPDYLALAKAFGCDAVRPQSLAELEAALRTAFEADRPTLIEVRQDSPFLP